MQNRYENGWIGTEEAAQRLGVKPATVYAYVSRGLLVSRRNPEGRGSLLDRAAVDRLAQGGRRGRAARQRVHRFRSVTSQVSHSGPDALYYRGHEVAEWSRGRSFEDGIELVLGVRPGAGTASDPSPATLPPGALPATVPLERRITGALVRLAESGWGATTDPAASAVAVASAYPALVDALAVTAPPDRSPRLAQRVVANLTGRPATDEEAAATDELLVQLLDHGLTASTTATRATASARAGIADCVLAGHAALAGHAHGRASERLHRVLRGDLAAGAGAQVGFGHFVYADGDPRADVALGAWEQVPEAAPVLAALARVRAGLPEGGRHEPNIDAALAVATVTLDLPPEAGTALFVLARTAGLAAHAAEEYAEDLLRWRGRAATRATGGEPA